MSYEASIPGFNRQSFAQYLNDPAVSHGTFETNRSEPHTRARWTPHYQLRSTTGEDGQTVITISGKITIKTIPADGTFGTKIMATKLVIDADQDVTVSIVPAIDHELHKTRETDVSTSNPGGTRSDMSATMDELFRATMGARYVPNQAQATRVHGFYGYDGPGHQTDGNQAPEMLSRMPKIGTHGFALNPRAAEFVPDPALSPTTSSVGLSGATFDHASPSIRHESAKVMAHPIPLHGSGTSAGMNTDEKRVKYRSPENTQASGATDNAERKVSSVSRAGLTCDSSSDVDVAI